MYSVYGVKLINGEKERSLICTTVNQAQAKHLANVATCHWADYAYVKSFGDGTIFFIRRPDYDEGPIDLMRLTPQPLPASQA